MSLPDGWYAEDLSEVRVWAEHTAEHPTMDAPSTGKAARFVLDVLAQAEPVPAPAEGAGEEARRKRPTLCPSCGRGTKPPLPHCDDPFHAPAPPAAPVGADQQDRGQQPCGICGSTTASYFVRVTDQRAGRPDPRLWCAACWERQHALNAAAPPSIPVSEGLRDLLGEAWKALDAAPDTPDMAHLLNRLNDAYIDLGGAPAPDPLPAREQLVKALIETCNPARRPSEWAVSLIADHADTLRAAATEALDASIRDHAWAADAAEGEDRFGDDDEPGGRVAEALKRSAAPARDEGGA